MSDTPTRHEPLDGLVHHHLLRGLIDDGRCPDVAALAASTGTESSEIEASMRRLAANHGLVLHPHACAAWIVHPFSASPTGTWVEQGERGWWAPCLWCALGVATLVGGDVAIHARLGGESEPVRVHVRDGRPHETGLLAHFALPPRHAWDNVHHSCAMLLPFRTEHDVDAWSRRHGLPRGEAVPLERLAALARSWYGRHAAPDYVKWTPAEAQRLFADAGLRGAFWSLDTEAGRF